MPTEKISAEDMKDKKPFKGFSTEDAVGGRIVQFSKGDEAVKVEEAKFENLDPGTSYLFRIVCTNPAGKSSGKPSKASKITSTQERTDP